LRIGDRRNNQNPSVKLGHVRRLCDCRSRAPQPLRYRLEVPADPAKRTSDDEEFLMSTYEIVEAWKREQRQAGVQEGVQVGIQEGMQKGRQESVIELYQDRFGVLQEDLVAIVRATHDDATLRDWLKLTGTGTADEIVARLRGHRAS
jgi:flagellar biosynthesis/type III secretory pathway protein FliH